MEETPGRASLEKLGCRTPPQLHAGGVGRQQVVLYFNNDAYNNRIEFTGNKEEKEYLWIASYKNSK